MKEIADMLDVITIKKEKKKSHQVKDNVTRIRSHAIYWEKMLLKDTYI